MKTSQNLQLTKSLTPRKLDITIDRGGIGIKEKKKFFKSDLFMLYTSSFDVLHGKLA